MRSLIFVSCTYLAMHMLRELKNAAQYLSIIIIVKEDVAITER